MPELKPELKTGDAAPPFTLESAAGGTVTLADLKSVVVLYFYPKDDTPGCTKEACAFREINAEIKKAGAVVLGVSMDSIESHQKFVNKYNLSFPLLSDPDGAVSLAYGVYKLKNMYGKTFWGIERTTFLIDPAGKIAQVYPRVKVDGHADAVLSAIQRFKTAPKS